MWLRHPHVTASTSRLQSGCVNLVSEQGFDSLVSFVGVLIILIFESNFPDIGQLGKAIANAIQSSLNPPQRTPLETVYNLNLN